MIKKIIMRRVALYFISFSFLPLVHAQKKSSQDYFNTNGYEKKVKFTSDQRKFNSWSISLHGGVPLLVKSELTSLSTFGGESNNIGYDVQLGITKHINHVIGVQLLGQIGQTSQTLEETDFSTKTNYQAISLIGDINLSSLFRRVDNKSRYAWALHAYGGVGLLGYKTEADGDITSRTIQDGQTLADIDLDQNSMFSQIGLGLQYKLSKKFDIEFKSMYVMTGDEQYDGSDVLGITQGGNSGGDADGDDNIWTNSIGLIYKIGYHNEHLKWYDPLEELYAKYNLKESESFDCIDKDKDGVCDQWDSQLDTPRGARVDGSGKALDVDLDGFIDLEDKCVTVPGVENGTLGVGCPVVKENDGLKTGETKVIIKETDLINLSDVEFYYNESRWYPEYNNLLDKAAKAVVANPDANFTLEGYTDSRGSDSYNLKLSQKRADAIRKYLISRGANPSKIKAVGKGETVIINQCVNGVKCSNEEHRVNRRVLLRADRKLVLPNN